MSFFEELKRRNVFRVAAAYVVASWLIMQIADVVLENIGAPAWFIKAMFLLLAIGFVVALTISWAYEMTPQGLKRERDIEPEDSITQLTAKRLDYVTVAAAIGVAGIFAWQQFSDPSKSDTTIQTVSTNTATPADISEEKTIAVLPFVNMSADKENEYFSDGISEELLNMLVRIEGLQVASRTSAFSFKGKGVDIPTVAAALRVKNIVEGSVRRDGGQVRITAQLVDVSSDRHLWSATYTRELKDVFAIQDEIATAIAVALKLRLLGESTGRRTDDIEAYDLYLLGRHHFHLRTPESLAKAIDLFEQSLAIDPEFALAYSGLADAYTLVSQYGNYDPNIALPKAEENARKAIALRPDLAEGHASLGLYLQSRSGKLEQAQKALRRAIDLNPDYSMAHMWLGTSLRSHPLEALAEFRAAEKVDPLHPIIAENIGDMLSRAGRFEEAAEQFDQAIANSPETSVLYVTRSDLEFHRGDLAAAYRFARAAISKDPNSAFALRAMVHAEMDLGNLDRAQVWLERFRKVAPNHVEVTWATFGLLESRRQFEELAKYMAKRKSIASPDAIPFLSIGESMVHLRLDDPEGARETLRPVNRKDVGFLYLGALVNTAFAQKRLELNVDAQNTANEGLKFLQEIRDSGYNQPWVSENEAVLFAILGDNDKALDKLQAAFDQGLRNVYGFSLLWMHEQLLGEEARFQAIREAWLTDVARQQEIIAAELRSCQQGSFDCKLAQIDDVQ